MSLGNTKNIYELKLRQVEKLLDEYDKIPQSNRKRVDYLNKSLELLKDVLNNAPELFTGDAANLWERTGHGFHYHDCVDEMEYCLRNLAELQPDNTDLYQNLGLLLAGHGEISRGISAYLKGVSIKPIDNNLNFDPAHIFSKREQKDALADSMDEAIKAAPGRAVMYKVKADYYFNNGNYPVALDMYANALNHTFEAYEYEDMIKTYIGIAECSEKLGEPEAAAWYRKKAKQLENKKQL
jgi:tetratricopeptide (TPR) repeat protein